MTNLLTEEGLVAVMRKQLQVWNNEKEVINEQTVHKKVVSLTDGVGGRPASAVMYQYSIEYTVVRNGGNNIAWPANWLDMTVGDLAEFIILNQSS